MQRLFMKTHLICRRRSTTLRYTLVVRNGSASTKLALSIMRPLQAHRDQTAGGLGSLSMTAEP